MEGFLRQYCGDPFFAYNFKYINFYKFYGKDKQKEKCVVQYPGNQMNR